MESQSMEITNQILTMFVVLALTGMVFSKASEKLKIPDVVLFLLSGILIGPSVLHLVSLESYPVANQFILTFGSAFILYEGGREIKLRVLQEVKWSVLSLSTLGVVLSATISGLIATYLFHIPGIYGFLLGAVVASTDPATLVPVFKEVRIKDRIKQTVISESAFNDAMGAILVISILAIITSHRFSPWENVSDLLIMIAGGIGVGIAVGITFSFLISEGKFGIFHHFAPIMSLVAVATTYILADLIGGSGYMATFVAGLICGNKKAFKFWIPEMDFQSQSSFRENIALLFRMAIFILLGTHIDFSSLQAYWLLSLIFVMGLMFVARPISVLICAGMDRQVKWTKKELFFMMWVRETGVIPAALSSMIVAMSLPHSSILSSAVFMTIIITLLVQASTTKILAKKLDLLEEDLPKERTHKTAISLSRI